MGEWNRKALRAEAASVVADQGPPESAKKRKMAVYSNHEEDSRKQLEQSASKMGNSCPVDDSNIQQPMGASEHDEVSPKMVESSVLKRGNSTPEEEFQIEQNNPWPVVPSEIQLHNERQQSAVALSCSVTPNNSMCIIEPSH